MMESSQISTEGERTINKARYVSIAFNNLRRTSNVSLRGPNQWSNKVYEIENLIKITLSYENHSLLPFPRRQSKEEYR
jgi:hypothetical protein